MNALLARLGAFVTRHHWPVIAIWLLLLAGLVVANRAVGANFVNDYTVPGSQSSKGLDLLRSDFSAASGYAGRSSSTPSPRPSPTTPTPAATMKNIGALPHVISATDPLTADSTPAVSKDGTIAYGTVSWAVAPASLDEDYLDSLDDAVEPARSAGIVVDYGGGAGQIGQSPDDALSEIIGLGAALLLLLLMFRALGAALVPLVGAVFSVGVGLSVVGLLASQINLPTTAPTVATLLGLGVAVDYGLFLVARHREQLDHGMTIGRSIRPPRRRPAPPWWSRAARWSSPSSASTSPRCRSSARWVWPQPSWSR